MKDFLNIYIKKYPFPHQNTPIFQERQNEINNLIDPLGFLANEKYFGWRLLESACLDALGVTIDSLNPRKLETGKWVIDNYYISLSNSGNYVMVGISSKPVGVDIQKIREIKKDYFIKEEMCDEEIAFYEGKIDWEYFVEHVEKEAIYKCYGTGPLEWKKINTLLYNDVLITTEFGEYILSFCSDLIKTGISYNLYVNDELVTFDSSEEEKEIISPEA